MRQYNGIMSSGLRAELGLLVDDLQRIFGERLLTVASYGAPAVRPAPCLALVESLRPEDLAACAARTSAWHRAGAGTPLLLTREEFRRSADAFPIEYAEIQGSAVVLHGDDPFAWSGGVAREDLRRACEVQVRSHLLHLREDYLECGGHAREVAEIVVDSAAGFTVLLRQLARLDGRTPASPSELVAFAVDRAGLDATLVDDVLALADPGKRGTIDAARLFPAYLEAVATLARTVDEWRTGPHAAPHGSITAS